MINDPAKWEKWCKNKFEGKSDEELIDEFNGLIEKYRLNVSITDDARNLQKFIKLLDEEDNGLYLYRGNAETFGSWDFTSKIKSVIYN